MVVQETTYGAPFNREVGRMFLDKSISMLSILNPTKNLKSKKISKPLIVRLYKDNRDLRVLNLGCGACGDVPLLEDLIRETLKQYGFRDPRVKITNVDIDRNLVSSVQNGVVSYFDYQEIVPNGVCLKSPILKRINQYLEESFTESATEEIELSNVVGAYKKKAKSFLMKPGIIPRISIQTGDASDLDFPNKSFDLVLANYLLQHLKGSKAVDCIKEMKRVTKGGGLIFPNFNS